MAQSQYVWKIKNINILSPAHKWGVTNKAQGVKFLGYPLNRMTKMVHPSEVKNKKILLCRCMVFSQVLGILLIWFCVSCVTKIGAPLIRVTNFGGTPQNRMTKPVHRPLDFVRAPRFIGERCLNMKQENIAIHFLFFFLARSEMWIM